MTTKRAWLISASAALALCASSEASACSIFPPSPPKIQAGETSDAFKTRLASWIRNRDLKDAYFTGQSLGYSKAREATLWEAAPVIALVRIVKIEGVGDLGQTYATTITLEVVQTARGKKGRRPPFKLWRVNFDSCAMDRVEIVQHGKVGDKFVVFAREGPIGMTSLIQIYDAQFALDERTTDLLGTTLQPPWQPEYLKP
jgi:hypothetical protein